MYCCTSARVAVPLAIFAWEATPGIYRWLFAMAVPGLVHAVLMTYSRGAMLSLLVASPLAGLSGHSAW